MQDEELLVWYNGEDNPEIAAALEEERTSNFNKKNSPRAKRGTIYLFMRYNQYGALDYCKQLNEKRGQTLRLGIL